MWHLVHVVAIPIAFLLGAFCVLTAILLYPNEEGKIQSKFEDVFVVVDDAQKRALTRNAAFMTQVAKLETRFLDRVFGHELISGQSLGASFGCSLGLVAIFGVIRDLFYPSDFNIIDFQSLYLGMLLCSLVVGAASVFIRKQQVVRRCLVFAAFVFITVWTRHIVGSFEGLREVVPFFSLTASLGFACDVAFISLTRRLLGWAGDMNSAFKVLAIVVLDFALALVLIAPVLATILFGTYIDAHVPDIILTYTYPVGVSNIFDTVLALLFFLLATMLLIHRLIWPLFTRTLFRMQDLGTKGRRGILVTVGLALLGWSGAQLPDLAKELLKAFQ